MVSAVSSCQRGRLRLQTRMTSGLWPSDDLLHGSGSVALIASDHRQLGTRGVKRVMQLPATQIVYSQHEDRFSIPARTVALAVAQEAITAEGWCPTHLILRRC